MTPTDARVDPIVYAATIEPGGEPRWFGHIQPLAGGGWAAWGADDVGVEGGVEEMFDDLTGFGGKVGGRNVKILAGPRSAMVEDRETHGLAWAAWTAHERWWRWGSEDGEPAQRYSKEDGCIINGPRKDMVEDFRQYLNDRGCRW